MKMRHYISLIETAQIDEIMRTPSHWFGSSEIRDGIRIALNTKRKRLAVIDGVVISIGDDGPNRKQVLFAEDKIALGFAELNSSTIDGIEGWFVTSVGLKDDLRDRNIGYRFYQLLLDEGFTLFSGTTQTRAGARTWEKLRQDPTVETSVHNIERDIRGQDVDPWAELDNVIIARRKR